MLVDTTQAFINYSLRLVLHRVFLAAAGMCAFAASNFSYDYCLVLGYNMKYFKIYRVQLQ